MCFYQINARIFLFAFPAIYIIKKIQKQYTLRSTIFCLFCAVQIYDKVIQKYSSLFKLPKMSLVVSTPCLIYLKRQISRKYRSILYIFMEHPNENILTYIDRRITFEGTYLVHGHLSSCCHAVVYRTYESVIYISLKLKGLNTTGPRILHQFYVSRYTTFPALTCFWLTSRHLTRPFPNFSY